LDNIQERISAGVLVQNQIHASAEEIFRDVNEYVPKASRATIYNSLTALVRAGLVRRLSTSQGPTRYDAALDRHHHFACDQGGLIEDIPWFPCGVSPARPKWVPEKFGRMN